VFVNRCVSLCGLRGSFFLCVPLTCFKAYLVYVFLKQVWMQCGCLMQLVRCRSFIEMSCSHLCLWQCLTLAKVSRHPFSSCDGVHLSVQGLEIAAGLANKLVSKICPNKNWQQVVILADSCLQAHGPNFKVGLRERFNYSSFFHRFRFCSMQRIPPTLDSPLHAATYEKISDTRFQ